VALGEAGAQRRRLVLGPRCGQRVRELAQVVLEAPGAIGVR
jgi:hypothetical protein